MNATHIYKRNDMNKTPWFVFRMIAGIAILCTTIVSAGSGSHIPYTGEFSNGGSLFSGNTQMKFALINKTATTVYWTNDGTNTGGAPTEPTNAVTVSVLEGIFTVHLGDTALSNMTALTSSHFASGDTYLRVWVKDGNSFTALSPDKRMVASAYALYAQNATSSADLNLSNLSNATTARANLGLTIGSNVEAYSANTAHTNQVETITSNWVNTANPWADNEVADNLTITSGTITNSPISGSTGSFTSLTATGSSNISGIVFPTAAGSANQILVNNGSGTLAWSNQPLAKDHIFVMRKTDQSSNISVGDNVQFDRIVSQVGDISYNTSTNRFTLKANRKYLMQAACRIDTTSGMTYYWYDVTAGQIVSGNVSGTRTSNGVDQPVATAMISPTVDTQIELRITYANSVTRIIGEGTWAIVETVEAYVPTSTSDLTVTGNATISTNILLANGSSTTPSLSFSSNAKTGLFYSAGNINIVNNHTEMFTLQSDSNIGIGTGHAEQALHIAKDYAIIKLHSEQFVASGTAGLILKGHLTDPEWQMVIQNNGFLDSAYRLRFKNNNATLLNITKAGKVGIGLGNTDATSKLHVEGNAHISGNVTVTGNITTSSNFIMASTGNVGIGTTNPTNHLVVYDSNWMISEFKGGHVDVRLDRANNTQDNFLRYRTNGSDAWIVGMDNTPSTGKDDFSIKTTNNSTGQFIIKTNGNVGIGMTSPTQKFEISGGNAKVGGDILHSGNALPVSDNSSDLGTSTVEYRHLYIDGIANIDFLQADAANITGTVSHLGETNLGDAITDVIKITGNVELGAHSVTDLGNSTRTLRNVYAGNVNSAKVSVTDTLMIGSSIYNTNGATIFGNAIVSGFLSVSGNVSGTINMESQLATSTTYTAGSYPVIIGNAHTAGGNIVVGLPAIATCKGRTYTIIRDDNHATHEIIVEPSGSEKINGMGNFTLFAENDTVKIMNTGGEWKITSDQTAPHIAHMTNTMGNQTIQNSTNTKIEFDTAEKDTAHLVDLTQNAIKIRKTGYYRVTSQMYLPGGFGVNKFLSTYIYRNSSSDSIAVDTKYSGNAAHGLYPKNNNVIKLNRGDIVILHVQHDQGGPQTTHNDKTYRRAKLTVEEIR